MLILQIKMVRNLKIDQRLRWLRTLLSEVQKVYPYGTGKLSIVDCRTHPQFVQETRAYAAD